MPEAGTATGSTLTGVRGEPSLLKDADGRPSDLVSAHRNEAWTLALLSQRRRVMALSIARALLPHPLKEREGGRGRNEGALYQASYTIAALADYDTFP